MKITLPEQLYLPQGNDRRKVPVFKRFDSIDHGMKGASVGFFKPPGGLWTCTWSTAHEDGWPWWLRVEGYENNPKWTHTHGYLMRPRPARVCEVQAGDQIDWLLERYGYDPFAAKGIKEVRLEQIDWTLFARDFDALRVLNPYSPDVRFHPRTTVFYAWDCESTWWGRWMFDGKPRRVRVFPREEVNDGSH